MSRRLFPELHDEGEFTPWGTGWTSPDNMGAEEEWVAFVSAWVALQRPRFTIETGAGAGRVTMAIYTALSAAERMGPEVEDARLLAFEADDHWRAELRDELVEDALLSIPTVAAPSARELAEADLVVLDSDPRAHRYDELSTWAQLGKAGSYALVHDALPGGAQRGRPMHGRIAEAIAAHVNAGDVDAVFTPNPRGGALLRRLGR